MKNRIYKIHLARDEQVLMCRSHAVEFISIVSADEVLKVALLEETKNYLDTNLQVIDFDHDLADELGRFLDIESPNDIINAVNDSCFHLLLISEERRQRQQDSWKDKYPYGAPGGLDEDRNTYRMEC